MRTIEKLLCAVVLAITAAVLLWPCAMFGANELQLTTQFIYTKGGIALQDIQNLSITVSGTPVLAGVFPTSTNNATLTFGSVTNGGYAVLVNGDTNSWSRIYYGPTTNPYPYTVGPGGVAIVELNTNAMNYASSTATPPFKVIILSK